MVTSTAVSAESMESIPVLSSAQLLAHWQSHRKLTRRLIAAFPEDQLFSFSIGGMRSFGAMSMELVAMAAPSVLGVVNDRWAEFDESGTATRDEVLRRWDEGTATIDEYWPRITAERFAETVTAFGMYTSTVYDLFLYVIDNEIHHRGQGYVYLRALGIEPPPFWERD